MHTLFTHYRFSLARKIIAILMLLVPVSAMADSSVKIYPTIVTQDAKNFETKNFDLLPEAIFILQNPSNVKPTKTEINNSKLFIVMRYSGYRAIWKQQSPQIAHDVTLLFEESPPCTVKKTQKALLIASPEDPSAVNAAQDALWTTGCKAHPGYYAGFAIIGRYKEALYIKKTIFAKKDQQQRMNSKKINEYVTIESPELAKKSCLPLKKSWRNKKLSKVKQTLGQLRKK